MRLELNTRIFTLLLFVVAVAANAAGQDPSTNEVMTNEKVMTLVQAGLPASIIVNKIRTSKTNFNTSTDELIKLKQAHVPDDVINAMLNPNASAATNPTATADNNGYPKEIGVYLKKGNEWVEVQPEVVNWKTGGVMKSIASAGVIKGDVNGHLEGNQSRTRVGAQIQFTIIAPEGISITEYQLIKLNQHKDNREFRTVTGGVFHAKGGATHDLVAFDGQKIASRTFSVTLNGLTVGEYGFLPPGAFTSASGASTLGKMYTFSVEQAK